MVKSTESGSSGNDFYGPVFTPRRGFIYLFNISEPIEIVISLEDSRLEI